MGYSKNITTLRSMQDQLQLLAGGQPCRWERPGGDADRWAYKIRECLSIAKRTARQQGENTETWIKGLAAAHSAFAIRVISPTLVEASFKTDLEMSSEPTPIGGASIQPAGRSHLIGEVKSLEDMMTVWSHAQPTNDPIHFPNCLLSPADLALAADWAASLKPAWMILKPKGTNSVTLAPDDSRVPAAAKVRGMRPAVGRDAKNNIGE